MKFTKLLAGHYRVSGKDIFSHISRTSSSSPVKGYLWQATIRRSIDGDVVRYAGLWPTLKEAKEESERLIRQIEG